MHSQKEKCQQVLTCADADVCSFPGAVALPERHAPGGAPVRRAAEAFPGNVIRRHGPPHGPSVIMSHHPAPTNSACPERCQNILIRILCNLPTPYLFTLRRGLAWDLTVLLQASTVDFEIIGSVVFVCRQMSHPQGMLIWQPDSMPSLPRRRLSTPHLSLQMASW